MKASCSSLWISELNSEAWTSKGVSSSNDSLTRKTLMKSDNVGPSVGTPQEPDPLASATASPQDQPGDPVEEEEEDPGEDFQGVGHYKTLKTLRKEFKDLKTGVYVLAAQMGQAVQGLAAEIQMIKVKGTKKQKQLIYPALRIVK